MYFQGVISETTNKNDCEINHGKSYYLKIKKVLKEREILLRSYNNQKQSFYVTMTYCMKKKLIRKKSQYEICLKTVHF